MKAVTRFRWRGTIYLWLFFPRDFFPLFFPSFLPRKFRSMFSNIRYYSFPETLDKREGP